jgi:2'-5' RNA ligase
MRLFIGVELDDAVKTRAAEIAETLRRTLSRASPSLRASWVKSENLHITLWFIGEVDDRRHEAIADAMSSTPLPVSAFDLSIGGCGAFPPSGPPRVFWIGIRHGAGHMAALYVEVAQRLAPLGYQPERRAYAAHVTLARVKDVPRADARQVRQTVSTFPADCGVTRVDAVTLFRSRLSPKGATYEPLLRVPLS